MSEEATVESAGPAGKGRKGAVMIAAVVALLGGAGAGAFAIGPMLAGGGAAASADGGEGHGESSEGGHGGGKKKEGGHGGGSPSSPVFSIENLVVNPAGTQGTRFLIATVAVEAKDADAASEMIARDPEIRDLLLGLLSKRTVDQLSDLDGRETLKQEILVTIEGVVGKGRVARVFIPQYVLQ